MIYTFIILWNRLFSVSLFENFAFHFSSEFHKNGIFYPANHYPAYKISEKVIAFK